MATLQVTTEMSLKSPLAKPNMILASYKLMTVANFDLSSFHMVCKLVLLLFFPLNIVHICEVKGARSLPRKYLARTIFTAIYREPRPFISAKCSLPQAALRVCSLARLYH